MRSTIAKGMAVLVAGLVAAAGGGLGVSVAGDDDEALVYDSVLGRTVPLAYQQALRDVEPSTLPEEGYFVPGTGIDPSRTPEEDARDESTSPAPPAIRTIPTDEGSNVPFPSGTIGPTTLFTESDGHHERFVWAGGAGCLYGEADSCFPGGNTDFEQTGMIIDQTIDLDGGNDVLEAPILVPGTGLITLTSFAGDRILFVTETGGSGSYSLATERVELCRAHDRGRCG